MSKLFMYLIIGLGNPGKKYQSTRHNVGFLALDFLLAVDEFGLGEFRLDHKFKAEIAEGQMNGQKVILAKPQTFMNNSGEAVWYLQSFYKIEVENIIVIYDELDLPFGKVRVRDEGSSAGHRGIESIIEKLDTDQFKRIRIGIFNKKRELMPADKFVLSRFSLMERLKLNKKILPGVMKEVGNIVK